MPKLTVASLGRCGSSMMFRTTNAKHKTHSHAHEIPSDRRVIFTFGNPVMIVCSLWNIYQNNVLVKDCGLSGKDFIKAHLKNMKATVTDPDEAMTRIWDEDVLRLEEMWDSFMRPQPYPLMTLRIEEAFRFSQEISDFIGHTVKINKPDTRKAITEFTHERNQHLRNSAYKSLCEKVAMADDMKIWS